MNKTVFWSVIILFLMYNAAFCGKSIFQHGNKLELNPMDNHINEESDFLLDTGKILKRDKRYLMWTNGGISKVIGIHCV